MNLPPSLAALLDHSDVNLVDELIEATHEALASVAASQKVQRADVLTALAFVYAHMANEKMQQLTEEEQREHQNASAQAVAEAVLNYARLSDEASALLN